MTNHQPAKTSDGGPPRAAISNTEQEWLRRRRTGLVLLITGILLLLWSWGSWYYRVSIPDERPVLMINDE